MSLDDPQSPGVHAIRVLAQMKQGLGDHWAAIRVLTKAIELSKNPERIQCFFLRGALTLYAHHPRSGAREGKGGWGFVSSHACAFATMCLHMAKGWGKGGGGSGVLVRCMHVPSQNGACTSLRGGARGSGAVGVWCIACMCLLEHTVPAHC